MDMEENIKNLMTVLDKVLYPIYPEQTQKLVESPVMAEFLNAPASYRADYVLCSQGGLLELSLQRCNNLKTMLYNFRPSRDPLKDMYNFSMKTIVLCGLFYELGKVGDYEQATGELKKYYKQSKSHDGYDVNNNIVDVPTQVRSVSILNGFGFNLSLIEQKAMLLGVYDKNVFFSNDKSSSGVLGITIAMAHRLAICQCSDVRGKVGI